MKIFGKQATMEQTVKNIKNYTYLTQEEYEQAYGTRKDTPQSEMEEDLWKIGQIYG